MIKALKIEKTFILFLIFISFEAGCTIISPNKGLPSYTPTSVPEIIATATFMPSLVKLITSTPIPEVEIKLNRQCVSTVNEFDLMPEGTIVLTTSGDKSPIYFYNLESGENSYIAKGSYEAEVSADFKYLAFIDSYRRLNIIDARLQLIKTSPVPSNWAELIQWIGESSLLVEKYENSLPYKIPPATTILFNPFNGALKEYPPNFPYIPKSFSGPLRSWGSYSDSLVVYDASFTRAVYPGFQNNDAMFVLWNIQEQKEIRRFYVDSIGNTKGAPKWKQDGSSVIIGIEPQKKKYDQTGIYYNVNDNLPYKGGSELFDISRDGKVKRLTYLTTKYLADEKAFSLSPDEKKIAFWLNLKSNIADQNMSELAILNIINGEITNYCIELGDNALSPIWSPDGKYLIITLDNFQREHGVFLVSLEQKKVMKINDNPVYAKGWLITPVD